MQPVRSWVATLVAMVTVFFVASVSDLPAPESTVPLFWFTIVVTLLCAIFAKVLILIGLRVGQPELGVMGTGLLAASLFPFVHGMNLPGVLVDVETGATSFSAWLALPAALAIALPAIVELPGRNVVLRYWKAYCLLAGTAVYGLAVLFLLRPNIVPAARPDQWWTVAGAAIAFSGAQFLAYRQVQLFAVGRRRASMFAAFGFSWLGMSALMWLLDDPSTAIIWGAHVMDGFGVLGAALGLMLSHRDSRNLTSVLAPVLNRDPAVALRLGVTPEIERFVARLGDKDHNTAGHVTRVAELAMRLAERAGITGHRLRTVGLGALLHDIGKTRVPDHILTKPGKLTDEEFDTMKQHTVWGEELLADDSLLAPVATLVRSHHERVDGRGYPDGLGGHQIPLDVSIISVADAWDAMIQSRHYRAGMSEEKARAIFAEHAGSQWAREAVDLLMAHLDQNRGLDGLFTDLIGEQASGCCAETVEELVEAHA